MVVLFARWSFVALVALAFILPSLPQTSKAAIPIELQASLFKKILSYDRTVKAKGGSLKVLLIGNRCDVAAAAFNRVGVITKIITTESITAESGDAHAVYFASAPSAMAKSSCETSKLLTLSGDVTAVDGGRASVALGIAGGRPQIVINLKSVKKEGHELSSQLLGLARVIK